MLKSEIAEVLDLQAQEVGKSLGLTRDALLTLPAVKGFATIITGVRRCGKSTLLRQWASASGMSVACVCWALRLRFCGNGLCFHYCLLYGLR